MILKVRKSNDPILRQPVEKVTDFGHEFQFLLDNMIETMRKNNGVGLAAPQVGHNLSLFIIKPMPESKTQVFINAKILKIESSKPLPVAPKAKSSSKLKKGTPLEGCLSIPRIWSPVKRPDRLLLEYQTITGEKKTEWFSGFEAIIIQHEVDHLNGVLFTQRSLEQNTPLFEEKEGELHKLKY